MEFLTDQTMKCKDNKVEYYNYNYNYNYNFRVYDKSTEIGSFVPAKVYYNKESDIIEEEVLQVNNCNPECAVQRL